MHMNHLGKSTIRINGKTKLLVLLNILSNEQVKSVSLKRNRPSHLAFNALNRRCVFNYAKWLALKILSNPLHHHQLDRSCCRRQQLPPLPPLSELIGYSIWHRYHNHCPVAILNSPPWSFTSSLIKLMLLKILLLIASTHENSIWSIIFHKIYLMITVLITPIAFKQDHIP